MEICTTDPVSMAWEYTLFGLQDGSPEATVPNMAAELTILGRGCLKSENEVVRLMHCFFAERSLRLGHQMKTLLVIAVVGLVRRPRTGGGCAGI